MHGYFIISVHFVIVFDPIRPSYRHFPQDIVSLKTVRKGPQGPAFTSSLLQEQGSCQPRYPPVPR